MELTREMILAMPAGREMDALIYEYVYKFKRATSCPIHGENRCIYFWDTRGLPGHPLSFSNKLSSAWLAVEKVYDLGLAKEYLRGLYAQGIVDLDRMAHHNPDEDCRAALLAILEDTGGTIGTEG